MNIDMHCILISSDNYSDIVVEYLTNDTRVGRISIGKLRDIEIFIDKEVSKKDWMKVFSFMFIHGIQQLFPDMEKQKEIYDNFKKSNYYFDLFEDVTYWNRMRKFITQDKVQIEYFDEIRQQLIK